MDLLHGKLVDGFCIVSSDSDYTGLAHRIREEGLFVMGIGQEHTPSAFVKACERFTFVEVLRGDVEDARDSKDGRSRQSGIDGERSRHVGNKTIDMRQVI